MAIQAPIVLVGHERCALLIEADTYEEIMTVLDLMGIDVEECDTGEIMPWEEGVNKELH